MRAKKSEQQHQYMERAAFAAKTGDARRKGHDSRSKLLKGNDSEDFGIISHLGQIYYTKHSLEELPPSWPVVPVNATRPGGFTHPREGSDARRTKGRKPD